VTAERRLSGSLGARRRTRRLALLSRACSFARRRGSILERAVLPALLQVRRTTRKTIRLRKTQDLLEICLFEDPSF
jgi:hypothetical protein